MPTEPNAEKTNWPDWMQQSDVIRLHHELVSIASLSHEEKAAADFLQTYAESHGVHVQRIDDNVVLSVGEGPTTLLLNSHLDVVPPSSDHPFEPFTPTLSEGRIYGRGTVDAKASVASMATALIRIAKTGLPDGCRLMAAFTVCEETGGTDNGLEAIIDQLPTPDAALIGEPTHMQPCVAQKGLLILRLDAHGTTSHAARAEHGDNAITRMMRDLTRVESWEFDRVHPFLGETTMNVTVIEGGTARNVIPDRCSAWLYLRTTPSYGHDEIAAMLDAALESYVVIHSGRFVPVETARTEPIVRACEAGHPSAAPFGSPTMSDWIHTRHVPTVKIGPGDSRLSHTAQEHVDAQELHDSCAIYERIIHQFFDQQSHRTAS